MAEPEEASITWRRSSASGGGNCVEVAVVGDDAVLIRDSKDPDGGRLQVSRGDWRQFVAAVKAGAFDLRRD